MSQIIDARGLSCPQPVLMTLHAIRKLKEEELIVLVDTDASRENVIRSVSSAGWDIIAVQNENDAYRITIARR
ncbi:MAG: sulfurtransferase TusA family protein [Syntrophorhabdaceae bacterium]|nr:sulfurtransferase TusA family protein [Syntrophorhabdaceae bacterium]MDD4197202.1 sulfurtransferase TusA family protein [Syntrophorhabdaceae bacterium]